jgi:hypothetical protein
LKKAVIPRQKAMRVMKGLFWGKKALSKINFSVYLMLEISRACIGVSGRVQLFKHSGGNPPPWWRLQPITAF